MTHPPKQILMIGHGSIAGYVAEKIAASAAVSIRGILCREGREAEARRVLGENIATFTSVNQLDRRFDVAVDCAGHEGLCAHGPALLHKGIDLITVSSGALADASVYIALNDAAEASGAKLHVLSGAIGAMDALAAAKLGGLTQVRYTGRKPPKGWIGSAAEETLDLETLTEAAVHFEGSAREAAQRYPKNANVAATIALAGLGMDATTARLIADPAATGNQHIIEARGAFGEFTFTITGNAMPGNPRSSALTAMSVVRALKNLTAPVIS